MLKSLQIKNFQSHKDTTLEFDKGITAIVGQSCAGKSAIFRGFRWIMDNRPLGNAFVSYWNRKKDGSPKNDTRIDIEFDSTTVARWKNENENAYGVNGVKLLTVGTDVPAEATMAHGLFDLHVSRQLDPHFLLSLSAGDVAKYLNGLVKLDIIDTVLAKADSNQRAIKEKIKTGTEVLEKTKRDLEAISFLKEAESMLEVMGDTEKLIQENTKAIATLSRLVVSMQTLRAESATKKELYDRGLWAISGLTVTNSSVDKINDNILQIGNMIKKVCHFDTLLALSPIVNDSKAIVSRIIEFNAEVVQVNADIKKLANAITVATMYKGKIVSLSTEIAGYKEELPKQCPVCGKPLEVI
jgi:exonuclease SbcC